MRIALTMRVTEAAGYTERRDSISHDWMARLAAWGMTPLLVPNRIPDPAGYLDGLAPDLLVLTGGGDLGEAPERDVTEEVLLAHALERRLPVLGVCRGLQLVNRRFGGGLAAVEGHVASTHAVAVAVRFREIYGAETWVNSFHRQGVRPDGLGRELAAFATDPDGLVEGLCHRTLPLAAVMWHPERAAAPIGDRRLIVTLIERGAFWT